MKPAHTSRPRARDAAFLAGVTPEVSLFTEHSDLGAGDLASNHEIDEQIFPNRNRQGPWSLKFSCARIRNGQKSPKNSSGFTRSSLVVKVILCPLHLNSPRARTLTPAARWSFLMNFSIRISSSKIELTATSTRYALSDEGSLAFCFRGGGASCSLAHSIPAMSLCGSKAWF